MEWRATRGTEAVPQSTSTLAGPVVAVDPGLFRLVFGAGASTGLDDFAQFDVKDNVLLVKNDSRTRASALAGGLFTLKRWSSGRLAGRTLDAFATLEFIDSTDRTLDGFAFGLGFSLNTYLDVVVAYSLRRGEELSHGFRRAAILAVEEDRKKAADMHDPRYAGFDLAALKHTGSEKEFDGFPVLTTAGGTDKLFSGNPIVESYNKSIHVGFLIPIKLKSIFNLD